MRRFMLTLVLLCVFITPALAQEKHWHISLKGGVNAGPTADAVGQGASATIDTEAGWVGIYAMGYTFKKIRVEGEIALRENSADTATLGGGLAFQSTGTSSAPVDGRILNLSYMVNGIYEFGGDQMRLRPFILGGVGFSRVKAILNRIGEQPYGFEDKTTTFAYQFGAGLEYPMTESLAIEVSYRFFGTPTVTFDDVDVTNTHHSGLVGLTLAF